MLYNRTIKEERTGHAAYCASMKGNDLPNRDLEVVIGEWLDGAGVEHSFLMIDRESSMPWKHYAENALRYSHVDLPGAEVSPIQLWSEITHATAGYVPRYKVFLHLIQKRTRRQASTTIIGVVLAEAIDEGALYYKGMKHWVHGFLPNVANVNNTVEVFVSIDRIWVDAAYRRKGRRNAIGRQGPREVCKRNDHLQASHCFFFAYINRV